jgi:hypothetical protein
MAVVYGRETMQRLRFWRKEETSTDVFVFVFFKHSRKSNRRFITAIALLGSYFWNIFNKILKKKSN